MPRLQRRQIMIRKRERKKDCWRRAQMRTGRNAKRARHKQADARQQGRRLTRAANSLPHHSGGARTTSGARPVEAAPWLARAQMGQLSAFSLLTMRCSRWSRKQCMHYFEREDLPNVGFIDFPPFFLEHFCLTTKYCSTWQTWQTGCTYFVHVSNCTALECQLLALALHSSSYIGALACTQVHRVRAQSTPYTVLVHLLLLLLPLEGQPTVVSDSVTTSPTNCC